MTGTDALVEAVARAIRKAATGTNEIGLYPLEKWRDQARAAITAVRPFIEAEVLERAATTALEQRCERGTAWDLACTSIATAIRQLKEQQS